MTEFILKRRNISDWDRLRLVCESHLKRAEDHKNEGKNIGEYYNRAITLAALEQCCKWTLLQMDTIEATKPDDSKAT